MNALITAVKNALSRKAASLVTTDSIIEALSNTVTKLDQHVSNLDSQASAKREEAERLEKEADSLNEESIRAASISDNLYRLINP